MSGAAGDLDDLPDSRAAAIAGMIHYIREQFGEPIALVVHSSRAGAAAPYAAMYGLELVPSAHVLPEEFRIRYTGQDDGEAQGDGWRA